ncbi:MAG: 1-acyl-sn-glycerol-3-phosphate acyltransferase [Candidatus Omnitrophica bacterium]|nr:1-acyl-sn-glycerol-3-phosphate acyltransferase [Candidatus Omnitrophota bacterium]
MFYYLIWWICYFVFKILFRYQIFGKEHLPREGPYIIAANHLSFLDPVALGLVTRKKLNFLAREDLFNNRIFALLIRSLGAIPLKREYQDIGALRQGIRILKKNKILVVFPEGKRALNGELGKPLLGVGFLAQQTKVKVVPVYLKGTDLALPVGACFIRLKQISAWIGKPVEPDSHPVEKIVELLWERLRNLSGEAKNLKKWR